MALWTFCKRLTVLFLAVYLVNCYRTIISLVFGIVIVYLGWKQPRDAKTRPMSAINDEQEDKRIRRNPHTVKSQAMVKVEWLKTVIPKVNLQDMEKAEWLNEVLQQAWPEISQYLKKLLMETIAPSIHFNKIDFGGKPVKVHGVKTHKGNEEGQILLYVDISYDGDVEINVAYLFGVKRIQLRGIIGLILGPLIGDAPIVGAVTMFFIQRPTLTITWTDMINRMNIFKWIDTKAMNKIESFLVWPNYHTVPQAADLLCSPTDQVSHKTEMDLKSWKGHLRGRCSKGPRNQYKMI